MLSQFPKNDKLNTQLTMALKELKVASCLRKAGITKSSAKNNDEKLSAFSIFSLLLSLVFQGMTLYRYLNGKKGQGDRSKNAYYRFLKNRRYNWEQFLLLLASHLIAKLSQLTRPNRRRVLILDDSVISKKRSKSMELVARVYDHVNHRFDKGFSLLTLGWSDGFSFVPLGFQLLSSAKKSNRYNNLKDYDKRSLAYKRRQKSISRKNDVAIELVDKALKQGVRADLIVMDTWFTHEPLIQRFLHLGLDTLGMVKQLKQVYDFNGQDYTLPQLRRQARLDKRKEVAGEIVVMTKGGIPVKIVFVRNRNKRSDFLYLLSTDLHLSKEEIVRLYGNRWKIECFFKAGKSLLKLGKEYQSPDYDSLVAQTTIVFTRYILIEWLRRFEQDERTYGDLFFIMSQEVQDLPFVQALASLLSLFEAMVKEIKQEYYFCQLINWINDQPLFIKGLIGEMRWES